MIFSTLHNIYEVLNFISSSDLVRSNCGWMKASLNSTKVLFQRIYQLLHVDLRIKVKLTQFIYLYSTLWIDYFQLKHLNFVSLPSNLLIFKTEKWWE